MEPWLRLVLFVTGALSAGGLLLGVRQEVAASKLNTCLRREQNYQKYPGEKREVSYNLKTCLC